MSDNPGDAERDKDGKDPSPPGPEDHGRDGGMATRELAPELAEPDHE